MSTALRTYIRGANLVSMTDQLGAKRFFSFDGQGTTQALSNSTGAVTDRFTADAWGVQLTRTGTSTNRYWYIGNPGYMRSVSIQTDYVRRRYLDNLTSRWLSVDPLQVKRKSDSNYSNVQNAPTLYIDPTGKIRIEGVMAGLWIAPYLGDDLAIPLCCGHRQAFWNFYTTNPVRCNGTGGWMVQKVMRAGGIFDCDNPTKVVTSLAQPDYWEAWFVEEGKSQWNLLGVGRDRTYTDSTQAGPFPMLGQQSSVGIIRFFCEGNPGIPDLSTVKSWQSNVGQPWGQLLGTYTYPEWWDSAYDRKELSMTRIALSQWNCCSKQPSNRYERRAPRFVRTFVTFEPPGVNHLAC